MIAEEQNPLNPEKTVQLHKARIRKRALTLIVALFSLIAIAYTFYWFFTLRFNEETDDAYVAGNQVQIMPQVSGSVIRINADNTNLVHQGDVLVEIDPTDAQQTFDRAQTALANSVRKTHQLMINNKQLLANIALKETAWHQAESDYNRRVKLAKVSAIAHEELQHAKDAVTSAQAAWDVAIEQYNANQALILDKPLEQQPAVLEAASQLREAWLALQRTKVISPIEGYVSRRNVQVGARVTPASPLMVVVPATQLWVDANFKETQLSNMRIGQKATVISDYYGDKVVYHGKVVGLDMGTGSAFSLLPAQNATGNWIKIVQRLPIRIALEDNQINQYPLRIGLSMRVTVDTSDKRGDVLARSTVQNDRYETTALNYNLSTVNQLITTIISENAS